MNAIISLASTVVACTFAALVARQFIRRRRPYQAVWAMALLVFAGGAGVETVANLTGWTLIEYRIWFVFGATLAAATLGLGSLYYALALRLAQATTAAVFVAAVWVAYRMFSLALSAPQVIPSADVARPPSVTALPGDVTGVVIVLNVFGTLALVGCAIWSAFGYRRSERGVTRALANLLIAAGGLIVAGSGSLAGLGRSEFLFLGEFAGITVIFLGFVLGDRGGNVRVTQAPRRVGAQGNVPL